MNLKTGFPFRHLVVLCCLCDVALAGGDSGGWVNYADETSSRLSVESSLGENDTQEKDYIVGDVDNDGDEDLIVVRKEPFTSAGRDINLLLMNSWKALKIAAEFCGEAPWKNWNTCDSSDETLPAVWLVTVLSLFFWNISYAGNTYTHACMHACTPTYIRTWLEPPR